MGRFRKFFLMEGGRGCKLWSQEHKSFLQQITSWPPLLNSPPPHHPALLAVTQIFHHEQNQQMSVELICDPVLDGENPPFATEWPPSTLKNRGHNSAYCCQMGKPNKEGGRVQLKTGLKLWENILQTVRRIDFQIIEVKGIAVIFIYSKSSSLNFQLLVEVVIKKAMGIFAWQAPISFLFGVFIFYDSLILSEYLVLGTRLSSLGVAIKYLWCSLRQEKTIFVYVAARACSDYWGLNSMFQSFS